MSPETIQELEKKKRYLKRYRRNKAQLERLEKRLAALDDRLYSLRSPSMSGMPRGGDPVTVADLVADKQELEDRINRLSTKGRRIKAEILEIIDNLDLGKDTSKVSEVLESFLIDCKDFDEIAARTGYTERHIIRLYSSGVKAMSVNCQ